VYGDNSSGKPDAVILATGSEVEIAVKAAGGSAGGGQGRARGVHGVLGAVPGADPRVQGQRHPQGCQGQGVHRGRGDARVGEVHWGRRGIAIGVNEFGASAPANILYAEVWDYSGRGCQGCQVYLVEGLRLCPPWRGVIGEEEREPGL